MEAILRCVDTSPAHCVDMEIARISGLGRISQFVSCNLSVSRRGEFDLQPGAAPSGVVSEAKVGKGTGSVP